MNFIYQILQKIEFFLLVKIDDYGVFPVFSVACFIFLAAGAWLGSPTEKVKKKLLSLIKENRRAFDEARREKELLTDERLLLMQEKSENDRVLDLIERSQKSEKIFKSIFKE